MDRLISQVGIKWTLNEFFFTGLRVASPKPKKTIYWPVFPNTAHSSLRDLQWGRDRFFRLWGIYFSNIEWICADFFFTHGIKFWAGFIVKLTITICLCSSVGVGHPCIRFLVLQNKDPSNYHIPSNKTHWVFKFVCKKCLGFIKFYGAFFGKIQQACLKAWFLGTALDWRTSPKKSHDSKISRIYIRGVS